MRSITLPITLLLTAAAIVFTAALPSNPRIPGLVVGLNPTCNRINTQASSARSLSETTDTGTNAAAVPRPVLSARDSLNQYSPSGVLRGNERSANFTLDPKTKWNAFWCNEREVVGGTVALWQVGPSGSVRVELAGMPREQLRVPFTPQAGRQYAVELQYPGPSLFSFTEPVISWYFATQ